MIMTIFVWLWWLYDRDYHYVIMICDAYFFSHDVTTFVFLLFINQMENYMI